MRLSCSTLVCEKKRYPKIEDALRTIAELGFDAADIAAFHGWQGLDPADVRSRPEEWARRIEAALTETGLDVVSINTGMSVGLLDPDSAVFETYTGEFSAMVSLAVEIGCPNITVNPGSTPEGSTADTAVELLYERIRRLSRTASQSSIRLSLEGHQGCVLEDPRAAREFIGRIWPDAGYTIDASHMEMLGYDFREYSDLADVSYHAHVRGASSGNMQATVSGGTLDIAGYFRTLDSRGYDRAVSIEYFNGFDPEFVNTLEIGRIFREVFEA